MNTAHQLSDPRSLGLSPERLQRIAAALNAEIAAGALPGAVLAIARHGKTGYFETFGWLDPAARSAMPRDAIFSIASMTKPLVTVGALMLYEEGRLERRNRVPFVGMWPSRRTGRPTPMNSDSSKDASEAALRYSMSC